MYMCAECTQHGCIARDMDKTMTCCPCKNEEIQKQAAELYKEPENYNIALNSAIVEAEGYAKISRVEEIVLFCKKMGYKKIGLVFCMGLRNEAKIVSKIFRHHDLEVVSVICKNGSVPKSSIGVTEEHTLSGCTEEVMCNPIGQALLMNQEKVEFNVLLGLCVGHDTLALKYIEAPATVLAVKDRLTGHNPVAAINMAESYHKKRIFTK